MNKYFYKPYMAVVLCVLSVNPSVQADEHSIHIKINTQTGAINQLILDHDPQNMNWILQTDGSQYPWITEKYGWGLGYLTLESENKKVKYEWKKPVSTSPTSHTPWDKKTSSFEQTQVYRVGNIRIDVKRSLDHDRLTERYTFTNTGQTCTRISDIGIYTPFNDNYPDATTCIHSRTHAHIWDGESAAYVNALRMGGTAPHLGLVLTEGSIKSYDILERGIDKGNSHTRGVIALNLPDTLLQSGSSYSIQWSLFPHLGNEDFKNKLLQQGSVWMSCNKYMFEKGEKAEIELRSQYPLKDVKLLKNGKPIKIKQKGRVWKAEAIMEQPGEVRFEILYNNGRRTHADCLVHSSFDKLIEKRTEFIRTHQQMNDTNDMRYGAYMVYDNEANRIYKNDTPNCNPVDRDEGAERLGMGILLAKQYLLTHKPELKESLLKYVRFVRERLQTEDYTTYSSVDQKGRNRGYNYMWVAELYFQMYKVTGNKQYAIDGYQTLCSMFRQFGYGFYAINIPVCLGLQSLKKAGMTNEYEHLKDEFIKSGDVFVKNGMNYPKHEVNYEQSIVAPALQFLLQLYIETGIRKYFDEAQRQLPVLEAFNGCQPSYYLHDISIRHWDGYWFGKRELFGDTMPHYWSTITAEVFHLYAQCTGKAAYQQRAEEIVRNNLCLFFEDGKASCAYVYPHEVNGIKAQFYDEYANDQDWALVHYLLVNKGL